VCEHNSTKWIYFHFGFRTTPGACQKLAETVRAGNDCQENRAPSMRHLTKNEVRIKLDRVFFQKGKKLCVKTHFPVMGFLVLNVSNDGQNHGAAHAERAVSLLPREFAALFVGPF
jgi:hypothetical protein